MSDSLCSLKSVLITIVVLVTCVMAAAPASASSYDLTGKAPTASSLKCWPSPLYTSDCERGRDWYAALEDRSGSSVRGLRFKTAAVFGRKALYYNTSVGNEIDWALKDAVSSGYTGCANRVLMNSAYSLMKSTGDLKTLQKVLTALRKVPVVKTAPELGYLVKVAAGVTSSTTALAKVTGAQNTLAGLYQCGYGY